MQKNETILFLTSLISPFENKYVEKCFFKIDWEKVIEIANKEYLIPLVYTSLKKKKLYDKLEDKQLKEYLLEIYNLNKQRNQNIIEQMQEIANILAQVNITPIFFKGSAALSERVFEYLGERVMTDIDFYIEPSKIDRAIKTLKMNGYNEVEHDYYLEKDWHHYYPLVKDGFYASIEIHRYFLNDKSLKYFFQKSLFLESTTINNAKVLDETSEFYLSFLHSEVSHAHHQYKVFALRDAQHFNQLLYKNKEKIDLEKIDKQMSNYSFIKNYWNEYLLLQKKYFYIPLNIVETKKSKKYIKDIEYFLNLDNSFFRTFRAFIIYFFNVFSVSGLQIQYGFQNKNLYILYFLKHMKNTFFKYLKREKRETLTNKLTNKYL